MKYSQFTMAGVLLLITLIAAGCKDPSEVSEQKDALDLNICQMVSEPQLRQLYGKPLYSKQDGSGCLWSKDQGGMAYLHITSHEYRQDLRKYFSEALPSQVKLEKITDLGDEGLMSITEGSLGVVVIRKGDMVLQSAVTFLDIAPGSEQQKVLWDIYRSIVQRL